MGNNIKLSDSYVNNIELFDSYIDEKLSPAEKSEFEKRLKEDKQFSLDFRVYLFVLDGIYKEAEQDDVDFATAMKNIGKKDLVRVLLSTKFRGIHMEKALRTLGEEDKVMCGDSDHPITDDPEEEESRIYEEYCRMLDSTRPSKSNKINSPIEKEKRRSPFRNILWIGSVAAMFIIGIFTVFTVRQTQMNRIDDIIAEYNYVSAFDRGSESFDHEDISILEKAYQNVPSDDIQSGEEAGMRLALAYIKDHDRKKAKKLLEELSERYAEDEEFVAQCQRILEQLK
ncbi:MAG: tetratricopeptide repeat protein [Muribaculaceae bacterium]|nr:tetratricopeptide repeat protein [Muribaculaceae bacterium]